VTGCERIQEALMDALVAGEGAPRPLPDHLAACDACVAEWEALRRTWLALAPLGEVSPGEPVRARILQRVQRAMIREWLLTVRGWLPAVLAAALGVGLSLGLAVLVPYASLVATCRQLLQLGEGHAAPYWLAGMVYGVPLAAGAWILRRRVAAGGVIGSLEASLLFLAVLAPFVLASCREFAPALLAAFVSGLVTGTLTASLAGFGLVRWLPGARVRF
jgi:hypothetical protein